MKRRFRLTRSTDFMRVRRSGKSYAHPFLVLVACPNGLPIVRIGVAAGRSVGRAVQRNRAKRRIRACLNRLLGRITTGWDMVFIARQPIIQAGFLQICNAVEGVLAQAGLLENDHAV